MKVQRINSDPGFNQSLHKKRIKKAKRLARFKRVLFLLLLITTLICLALSPLCTIMSVKVEGNSHYNSEIIIGITGISIGNNGFKTLGGNVLSLLTLRYRNAEKNLMETLPYLKDVRVKYIIPNGFIIKVIERNAIGLVKSNNENLLVDREAQVLENVQYSFKQGIPLIQGLGIKEFEIGKVLKLSDMTKFNNALEIMDELNMLDKKSSQKMFALVTAINVDNPQENIISIDSRIDVNLGDLKDLNYKLNFLREIYFKELSDRIKGIIDFTTGQYPVLQPSD